MLGGPVPLRFHLKMHIGREAQTIAGWYQQIGQTQQREQLRRVLGQTPVA